MHKRIIAAACIIILVLFWTINRNPDEHRSDDAGGSRSTYVADATEEAHVQSGRADIDVSNVLRDPGSAVTAGAHLPTEVPLEDDHQERAPQVPHSDSLVEETQRAHELLEELSNAKPNLTTASPAELTALKSRIRERYRALCDAVFRTRHSAGLFETRLLEDPVSMRSLEREFGCKLGILSEQQRVDGRSINDIVLYPRNVYPEIYELDEYDQAISEIQTRQ